MSLDPGIASAAGRAQKQFGIVPKITAWILVKAFVASGAAVIGIDGVVLRRTAPLGSQYHRSWTGYPALEPKYVSLETSAHWPHLPKKLVEPSQTNSNGSFWR
jgi:hypothetical protein